MIENYLETYALYMILCQNRDKLKKYLEKLNIEDKIHYDKPLHLQKASRIFGYKKGLFPNAEKQSKQLLTIPIHQFLKRYHNFKKLKFKAFVIIYYFHNIIIHNT